MVKPKSAPENQGPACKECQRRKQKCSREWPCKQCTTRRVPHLCLFGERKNVSEFNSEGIRASVSRKRTADESELSSGPSSDTAVDEGTGLVSWGYMSESKLFEMDAIVHGDTPAQRPNDQFIKAEELEQVLRGVPQSRSIMDALVQNYLYSANFRYYWLYPPTFTKQYSEWWDGRQNRQTLSPDFTCLLLRLCAVSTQHLNNTLRENIEFECTQSYEEVGKHYFDAADKLNATLTPATCTIARAQQLMFKASWYKAEGEPSETWHAVGEAVRASQELGMHNGIDSQGLDEFETEMRKRLWCTLYIWDWQMSAWLNRPLIIDHSTCILELPSLQLEKNDEYPELPSPFTHMALQAALIQTLSHRLRTFGDMPPIERVKVLQGDIQAWIDDLPPAYSMTRPLLDFDKDFPYLILQRLQLHACAWMLKLDSYKSFLTRDLADDAPAIEVTYRASGVDCALNLHAATSKLYAFEHPIGTKFHLVSFLLFDVALLFGSAIFHDQNGDLPRRGEVLSALDEILDKFYTIGETTKSGANASIFLSRLVGRLKLKPGERVYSDNMATKRAKIDAKQESSDDSSNSRYPASTGSDTTRKTSGDGSISSNDEAPAPAPPSAWPQGEANTMPTSDFEKHFHSVPITQSNTVPQEFAIATDIPVAPLALLDSTINNVNLGGIERIIGWDNYNFDLTQLDVDPNWLYDPQLYESASATQQPVGKPSPIQPDPKNN